MKRSLVKLLIVAGVAITITGIISHHNNLLLIGILIALLPAFYYLDKYEHDKDYNAGFKAGEKHAQDTVNEWYRGEDKECEH